MCKWTVLQTIITVELQTITTVIQRFIPQIYGHHSTEDLQLYNVLRHGYIDPTTIVHHCRTDLQLYNVLNHKCMESAINNHHCRTDLQLYNVLGPLYNLSSA